MAGDLHAALERRRTLHSTRHSLSGPPAPNHCTRPFFFKGTFLMERDQIYRHLSIVIPRCLAPRNGNGNTNRDTYCKLGQVKPVFFLFFFCGRCNCPPSSRALFISPSLSPSPSLPLSPAPSFSIDCHLSEHNLPLNSDSIKVLLYSPHLI